MQQLRNSQRPVAPPDGRKGKKKEGCLHCFRFFRVAGSFHFHLAPTGQVGEKTRYSPLPFRNERKGGVTRKREMLVNENGANEIDDGTLRGFFSSYKTLVRHPPSSFFGTDHIYIYIGENFLVYFNEDGDQ